MLILGALAGEGGEKKEGKPLTDVAEFVCDLRLNPGPPGTAAVVAEWRMPMCRPLLEDGALVGAL